NRGLIVGWSATGVLAAGAITTTVLAFRASSQLQDARRSFPVAQADLDRKASTVRSYAIAADVLTALTLVTGGVTLTYTLTRSPSHEVTVAVVPGGVQLAGSFR
ncbi:MAG: hypothetical protein H7138_19505, partial [Myxococcales bacterium]|nr:hypothetical protein [Myxococcales bacterium]